MNRTPATTASTGEHPNMIVLIWIITSSRHHHDIRSCGPGCHASILTYFLKCIAFPSITSLLVRAPRTHKIQNWVSIGDRCHKIAFDDIATSIIRVKHDRSSRWNHTTKQAWQSSSSVVNGLACPPVWLETFV